MFQDDGYVFVETDRSTVSKLIARLKDDSMITTEHYMEVWYSHNSLSCSRG